jgi:hypothetical protein
VRTLRIVLFVIGYPVAIAVIVRWIPVVRERRWKWFAAEEGATACIVAGQAIGGSIPGIAINSAWFVVAAVWYALGGRRRAVV